MEDSRDALDLTAIRQALEELDDYVRRNGGDDASDDERNSTDGLSDEAEGAANSKRSRAVGSIGSAASVESRPAEAVLDAAFQQADQLLWKSDDVAVLESILVQCACATSCGTFLEGKSPLTNHPGPPKGR